MSRKLPLTLTEQQIRRLRLRAHCLDPLSAASDVTALVRGICGIQAQDRAAAELAAQPRSRGLTIDRVRRALEVERSIVRTWAMRGTIHMLAADEWSWMLPLLGPIFVRKGRRRLRELGIDEETRDRALDEIRASLVGQGALTRAELTGKLGERSIPVEGQAGYHLIYHAALEGIVCFGADRDGAHTFVLVEEWLKADMAALPLTLTEEAAVSRLARRYLKGFGPAGPHDFASWSGLGMRQARAGFESNMDHLLNVEGDGPPIYLLEEQAGWLDEPETDEVTARLLPMYDPLLLGYQRRDWIVPEKYARRVHPGGGVIRATMLVNGRAAGNWRLRRGPKGVAVEVEPFETLSAAATSAVEREVHDLERYCLRPDS